MLWELYLDGPSSRTGLSRQAINAWAISTGRLKLDFFKSAGLKNALIVGASEGPRTWFAPGRVLKKTDILSVTVHRYINSYDITDLPR